MTTREVYDVLMRMHMELNALVTDEEIPAVQDNLEDARLSLCEALDFIAMARGLKWSIDNLETNLQLSTLPC